MKRSCPAMAEPHKFPLSRTLSGHLYPLWMIAANLVSRLGGTIILVLIGHAFAPTTLAPYFAMLAMVGLAVTATQAGSGPLLIRLAQAGRFGAAVRIVGLRIGLALAGILWIMSQAGHDLLLYWPLLLLPVSASLSPDWVIAARTGFSRLALIAVLAQLAGIAMAVFVTYHRDPAMVFAIAPAISVTSLIASGVLAFLPETHPHHRTDQDSPTPAKPDGGKTAFGLIGFTLLAGFLPNLDFVLLGDGQDRIFMAQRVFLVAAGFLAAISGALFARRQTGKARDLWLVPPMAVVSAVLFWFPEMVGGLVFASPDADLVALIQSGAFWPVLFALVTRQVLILQETPPARWLGWACLFGLIATAALLPVPAGAEDILVLMQLRLVVLIAVFHGFSRRVGFCEVS